MLNITELRKLSVVELRKELEKTQFQFGHLRFALKAGQEKASHKLAQVKKYIAHIHTVTTEKELG